MEGVIQIEMHNASATAASVRKTNIQHLQHKHSKMHRYINQSSCGLSVRERMRETVGAHMVIWDSIGWESQMTRGDGQPTPLEAGASRDQHPRAPGTQE